MIWGCFWDDVGMLFGMCLGCVWDVFGMCLGCVGGVSKNKKHKIDLRNSQGPFSTIRHFHNIKILFTLV